MKPKADPSTDLSVLNPIRVETALCRYPVHRLAKQGTISIDIQQKTATGEIAIKWEVNHVTKFGQAGPLAYKLDTLVINRRIEEADRPIPRIIRLGSLSEICRELGQVESGKNTTHLKNALRQNAFAAIIAKIRYRDSDGTERDLEADFNRYSVVFTGERLPDGRRADAVYIVLNDVFMKVINGAMTRPLDYEYLKTLPPGPQRFYELLSYQMYATLKHDRGRAKLKYSEFCIYAPQTRYLKFDQVKKQMYKIHNEHRKSGYISGVNYQETVDGEGKPDWIMLYQPGPKAKAEFRTFTKRGGPVLIEMEPFSADPIPLLPAAGPSVVELELMSRGMTPATAAKLVSKHGEETVGRQIEYLDWEIKKKPGKIGDQAAWLFTAITDGHGAPKGFISRDEQERRAEAKKQREQEAAEQRRRKQETEKNERRVAEQIKTYRQSQTPEQLARLEADAIASASEETRHNLDNPALKAFRKTQITMLTNEHIARLIQAEEQLTEPA